MPFFNGQVSRFADTNNLSRPRGNCWGKTISHRFGELSQFVRTRAGLQMDSSSSSSNDDIVYEELNETRDRGRRPTKTFSEIFADDAILITRLTVILLKLFGFGWKWIVNAFRLAIFVALLFPAFVIMFGRYLFSSNIKKRVRYCTHGRNFLDIYMPKTDHLKPESGWPVVIYFTGGAWIIGHRAWAAIMGWEMSQKGVVFVSVDYRNFPQGRIIDMMVDANNAIAFVFDNITVFNGDANNITLCGQSAGAHIAAMALISQCKWEQVESRIAWRPSQLRRFVGISGPYDLEAVCYHLHGRGLYRRVLRRIMGRNLAMFSPTYVLNNNDYQKTPLGALPSVFLFHGDTDRTVPETSSIDFYDALKKTGANVKLRLIEGKTHTDLILEDSMSGFDPFLVELISIIRGEVPPTVIRRSWPMCFRWQITLARYINPF